jgi:hypothetical protein
MGEGLVIHLSRIMGGGGVVSSETMTIRANALVVIVSDVIRHR